MNYDELRLKIKAAEKKETPKPESPPGQTKREPDLRHILESQESSSPEKEYGGSDFAVKKDNLESAKKEIRQLKEDLKDRKNIQIRNFPASIHARLRVKFPNLRTNTDVLIAAALSFLHLIDGEEPILEDTLEDEIVKSAQEVLNGKEAFYLKEIEAMLKKQNERVYELSKTLSGIELAVAFSVYDRSGFRTLNAKSPGSIDFLEGNMVDTIERLRDQSGELRQREQRKNGRPYR